MKEVNELECVLLTGEICYAGLGRVKYWKVDKETEKKYCKNTDFLSCSRYIAYKELKK
jgi:hypothetical protein